MSTKEVLGQASVLRQAVTRSRMCEAARSKDILVEVIADRDGYLDTQSVDWETYWHPHAVGLSTAGRQQFDELQRARETYLASGFDVSKASAYCYRYFRLLRSALRGTIGQPGPLFLQALSGLEAFGVRGFRAERPLAAGVINVRQPGWLLGRLRWPRAQADPKFLPLACLPPSITGKDWPARLFYHYRQISLEADTGISLLVCPAVSLSERPVSFELIEWLTAALRAKPDPWSRRRAKQIADGAIGQFLAACATRLGGPPAGEIAFADIGGGSGILVSHLCQHLLQDWTDVVAGRLFAWTFVDLNVRDPARHTRSRRLRGAMSFAEYVQSDYRSWTLREAREPATPQWHVALVCRLLNNLSTFSVEWTTDGSEKRMLAGSRTCLPDAPNAAWQPVDCLLPDATQPSRLIASIGQVALRGGRSMRQLSLTDYFEALHRLTSDGAQPTDSGSAVFFPLRRFNPEALVLEDGSSLFERLCAIAELVVVEDVDLAPSLLVRHLEDHRLDGLAASDATDARHMHSAYLLCIGRRELMPCLPGRRIW
ncbi:MAG: hypothetical protein NTY65_00965 [Planctomycetota bacterium]|nr:hypothetical protein [Planctomycetota bacterium]